ncbi:hypothetical protein [Yoonia sediminilitoris]|uniref:Ig-like domain-containing protein n=1 Tax=Yoonia sediminilitoris TaxID=1286148 RepID=A0A2T6KAI2_9RHOB|nr:hypothetical protein [Yoonia sediminilitoris]PUB11850.1 hypothetical protein C8N45_11293 [Yoonia sediminilitoris]RCW91927.1 hypothetical protein DFP92_11293 [Yoonia sediminilitoris]
MRFGRHPARQALLTALATLPLPALAEVSAQYDPSTGAILVSDVASDDTLRLTVAGQTSKQSTPFTVSEGTTGLIVTPRFALRAGTVYRLAVGDALLDIAVPAEQAQAPRVAGFSPSQAVIPANTLRLYITFTEPMARGQLLDHIRLIASDGSQVVSPFLNLEAELWDTDQRRATLLLDPGRIKQGVGPNTAGGAPLQAGENYRLIVPDQMRSAASVPLDAPVTLAFRVGPAERRPIDPADWDILAPRAASLALLSIGFDRIMDTGTVMRLLRLEAPDGSRVHGEINTDGGSWSIAPTTPWAAGTYRLIVAPELEDLSGNTPGAPFDASAGTISTVQNLIILTIDIAP